MLSDGGGGGPPPPSYPGTTPTHTPHHGIFPLPTGGHVVAAPCLSPGNGYNIIWIKTFLIKEGWMYLFLKPPDA